MSWLPKRDKLDPVQASAIDFAVAQEGSFYIRGEAGTGKSVAFPCISTGVYGYPIRDAAEIAPLVANPFGAPAAGDMSARSARSSPTIPVSKSSSAASRPVIRKFTGCCWDCDII